MDYLDRFEQSGLVDEGIHGGTAAASTGASAGRCSRPDLKGNYNTKSGLITPALESESDVQVVTTETVPGRKCTALSGPETQFPAIVLPTSGALAGRTLADGLIREMKTLRGAAVEAGANAVVGLRSSPYITRNGNPRMILYGTLAQ